LTESAPSEQAAIEREWQIKRWAHAKRLALSQRDFIRLNPSGNFFGFSVAGSAGQAIVCRS
jgi:hypothetical protein